MIIEGSGSGSVPVPRTIDTDTDPGGFKPYGSGSATLVQTNLRSMFVFEPRSLLDWKLFGCPSPQAETRVWWISATPTTPLHHTERSLRTGQYRTTLITSPRYRYSTDLLKVWEVRPEPGSGRILRLSRILVFNWKPAIRILRGSGSSLLCGYDPGYVMWKKSLTKIQFQTKRSSSKLSIFFPNRCLIFCEISALISSHAVIFSKIQYDWRSFDEQPSFYYYILLRTQIMFRQRSLELEWFILLKELAHFWP